MLVLIFFFFMYYFAWYFPVLFCFFVCFWLSVFHPLLPFILLFLLLLSPFLSPCLPHSLCLSLFPSISSFLPPPLDLLLYPNHSPFLSPSPFLFVYWSCSRMLQVRNTPMHTVSHKSPSLPCLLRCRLIRSHTISRLEIKHRFPWAKKPPKLVSSCAVCFWCVCVCVGWNLSRKDRPRVHCDLTECGDCGWFWVQVESLKA